MRPWLFFISLIFCGHWSSHAFAELRVFVGDGEGDHPSVFVLEIRLSTLEPPHTYRVVRENDAYQIYEVSALDASHPGKGTIEEFVLAEYESQLAPLQRAFSASSASKQKTSFTDVLLDLAQARAKKGPRVRYQLYGATTALFSMIGLTLTSAGYYWPVYLDVKHAVLMVNFSASLYYFSALPGFEVPILSRALDPLIKEDGSWTPRRSFARGLMRGGVAMSCSALVTVLAARIF